MTGINQVLRICWDIVNKSRNVNNNDNNSNQTVTMADKTLLQALALINDCDKYKMELTTNGIVITDAIKIVQTNKQKLMSSWNDNSGKKSNEPDYDEDKDQLEEKQEVETGKLNQTTTNQVF